MLRQLDIQAPLLAIGVGRSGTTLFMRILRSHPEIDFKGETNFLVPRLWRESFENRFWYNWKRYVELNPHSAFEALPPLDEAETRKLEQHVGAALAKFVAVLLGVNHNASIWGYKELWNGSASFDFEWTIYDHVFPRATWVHLVRNPFSYCQSAARWRRLPLDVLYIVQHLSDWVSIVRRSRERTISKQYFEIRYEDLVEAPRRGLEQVLRSLGIDWKEELNVAVNTTVLASEPSIYGRADAILPDIGYFAERVKGLSELMGELHYEMVPLDLEVGPVRINYDAAQL